jgi:hypothetical protein
MKAIMEDPETPAETRQQYVLVRITPACIREVARGDDLENLRRLAALAARSEDPDCGWVIRAAGDKAIVAEFWAGAVH